VRFFDHSVERGVEADCRFDSGIRRLATERQEVRRGVKSGSFISHLVASRLLGVLVLSRSFALVCVHLFCSSLPTRIKV